MDGGNLSLVAVFVACLPMLPAVTMRVAYVAAGFARLLLWTDPRPLPAIGDVKAAWQYYLRNWRPGKPHEKTWAPLYAEAMEEVSHVH